MAGESSTTPAPAPASPSTGPTFRLFCRGSLPVAPGLFRPAAAAAPLGLLPVLFFPNTKLEERGPGSLMSLQYASAWLEMQ